MAGFGRLLDKDDPQGFVWLGRSAASNGVSSDFLDEMSDQMRSFNSGSGHASCFRNRTSFERTNRQRVAHNVWERLQL
jgi:hypothetical protein